MMFLIKIFYFNLTIWFLTILLKCYNKIKNYETHWLQNNAYY